MIDFKRTFYFQLSNMCIISCEFDKVHCKRGILIHTSCDRSLPSLQAKAIIRKLCTFYHSSTLPL